MLYYNAETVVIGAERTPHQAMISTSRELLKTLLRFQKNALLLAESENARTFEQLFPERAFETIQSLAAEASSSSLVDLARLLVQIAYFQFKLAGTIQISAEFKQQPIEAIAELGAAYCRFSENPALRARFLQAAAYALETILHFADRNRFYALQMTVEAQLSGLQQIAEDVQQKENLNTTLRQK